MHGVGGVTIDEGVYEMYEYSEVLNSLRVQFFARKMNSDKTVELSGFFKLGN